MSAPGGTTGEPPPPGAEPPASAGASASGEAGAGAGEVVGPARGLVLAALIAAVATLVPAGLGWLPPPWSRLPLSPILLSIAIGVSLAGAAARRPALQRGMRVATDPLLKLAVILIGLRLGLGELFELGFSVLPLVALVVVGALGATLALSRWLGVPSRLGALLAVGTAICGTSAIAATAPGLRARSEEVAYAVACVALFGLAATLVYPPLFHLLLDDPRSVGTALGAAIHDTAQVTGAALLYEQLWGVEGTLAAASVTKLLRNLAMLVVIPLVVARFGERAGEGARAPFPLFVLGFVAASLLRTLGDGLLPDDAPAWGFLLSAADQTSGFLFAMAMAAVGMSLRPAALLRLGWRPAGVALLVALLSGAIALLWIR